MYEVYLGRTAEKDLLRLSADNYKRIILHLTALEGNPKPHGCRKITGSKNDWRIRIGKYRIIYEINEVEKTIKIFRIKHRREVYR